MLKYSWRCRRRHDEEAPGAARSEQVVLISFYRCNSPAMKSRPVLQMTNVLINGDAFVFAYGWNKITGELIQLNVN